MHQPVEDFNMNPLLEKAIKRKAELICEYFIKLCLYYGNGVNISYESNDQYSRIKDNEYLMLKRRSANVNTAMVYLLDKYISDSCISPSLYDVKWIGTYQYLNISKPNINNFLTIEIEYNNHIPVYFLLEILDHESGVDKYIIYDHGELIMEVNDKPDQFFNIVDDIIKMFHHNKNMFIIDDLNKFYSERIGAPDIHVPINSLSNPFFMH